MWTFMDTVTSSALLLQKRNRKTGATSSVDDQWAVIYLLFMSSAEPDPLLC